MHTLHSSPRPALDHCNALAVLLAIAATSAACGNEELAQRDLGNTSSDLALNEPQPADRTPIIGPDLLVDPFIEGEWIGQAEDLFSPSGPDGQRPVYTFPSGSTAFWLSITLGEPPLSEPTGSILFGEGTIPQPQRGLGYPPEFDAGRVNLFGTRDLELAPQEGRVYPLTQFLRRGEGDTGVAAGALALSYPYNLAYLEWCELQPSNPGIFDDFFCADPITEGHPPDRCTLLYRGVQTPLQEYDCDQFALCDARNICECNELGCIIADAGNHHLWLVREGDALLGTLVGAVFDHGDGTRFLPVGTVRFERAPSD